MLFTNEEEDGRVLSDAEIVQALQNRDDIFSIEKARRLPVIAALCLAIDIIACLWLTSVHPAPVAHDIYSSVATVRMAKLLKMPAIEHPAQNEEEVIGNQHYREEIQINPQYRNEFYIRGFKARETSAPDRHSIRKAREAAKPPITAGLPSTPPIPPMSGSASPKEVINPSPDLADRGASGRGTDSLTETGGMAAPGPDQRIEDSGLIREGYAEKRKGSYAPAFAALFKVLRNNPHDTLALAGVGDLFLYSGLLDSATAFYAAALAVNPRMVAAHKGLGTARYYVSTFVANPLYAKRLNIADPARYIKSLYDSAMAEYSTAIAIDSTYVSALTDRGELRDMEKDYDGAIRDYTRAIAINPSFADAYSKRAMTYRTLGRYREALADYTAAVKLGTGSYEYDPDLFYANVFFGRGVVYLKMGAYDKAVADFDTTLSISPRHSLAVLNKAIALSDAKRYDSAIAAFTRAIAWLGRGEYGGARFRAFLNRGDAFMAQGKFDNAIEDYKAALESPALAARSCWRIAECFSLKRDRADAISWLKKSIGFGFNDFKAWEQDPTLSILRGDKDFRDLVRPPR